MEHGDRADFGGFGICVTDVDRMTQFYVDGLGCVLDEPVDMADSITSKLGVVPDGLAMTVLTTPSGAKVKFVRSPRQPATSSSTATITGRTGITYMTFYVTDVVATRDALVRLGGASLTEPELERAVAFVSDPEGNLVELLRRPRTL
jgi:catechol 2,3-dioxygenase-like lactoylglutathione lyase family enzyme